jgi:hypothetical protein
MINYKQIVEWIKVHKHTKLLDLAEGKIILDV